jgi:hypothetical protein
MRLLVSVADVADAHAALAGGADIVDAKDPTRGGLGAVRPGVLRSIHAAVHPHRPVSAALGDAGDERRVTLAARAAAAVGLAFVKIGFGGVTSLGRARTLAAAAVRGARDGHPEARVILTAYADTHRAASVPPAALLELAAHAGAAGVLLDTALKDGGGLFSWLTPDDVHRWIERAHGAGLLTAVAGKLDGTGVRVARELGADVAGVRGAACVGGRGGQVSAERVRALRAEAGGRRERPAGAAGAAGGA